MERLWRPVLLTLMLATAPGGCGDDPTSPTPVPPEPYWVDEPFSFGADEYLRDRFFQLDLPAVEPMGRQAGERVVPESILIFRREPPGQLEPHQVQNIAAYVDSTGFRAWPDLDFTAPSYLGVRWSEVQAFDLLLDEAGNLRAVDLRSQQPPESILAVVYRVEDATGATYQVGDDPRRAATQEIPGHGGLFYRMKLLKVPAIVPDPHVFAYALRNIYSLGATNIDAQSLTLEIAANDLELADPAVAAPGLPWFRLFGLDRRDAAGLLQPDGVVDLNDEMVFDLARGLLKFPADLPRPFAAEPATYEALAAPDSYPFDGSYLSRAVMPEIYDPAEAPRDYPRYRRFLIRGTRAKLVDPSRVFSGPVDLARTAWLWAAVPAEDAIAVPLAPEGRADHVRWFTPRERVLAWYLDPELVGSARSATVPALDLYLRNDEAWAPETWGGITTGVSRSGLDFGGNTQLEIWVNDHRPDAILRSGRLHLDVGIIAEDGFWPRGNDGELVVGTWEQEDGILPGEDPDGLWTLPEDIGLDGRGAEGPQRYRADYEVEGDAPYPFINGTAANNREDNEDINRNSTLDREDGYFTTTIDLAMTPPDIDVVADHDDVAELVASNIAWRRYVVPLEEMTTVTGGAVPTWARVTHLRVWFDDPTPPPGQDRVHLQIAGFRFVE